MADKKRKTEEKRKDRKEPKRDDKKRGGRKMGSAVRVLGENTQKGN